MFVKHFEMYHIECQHYITFHAFEPSSLLPSPVSLTSVTLCRRRFHVPNGCHNSQVQPHKVPFSHSYSWRNTYYSTPQLYNQHGIPEYLYRNLQLRSKTRQSLTLRPPPSQNPPRRPLTSFSRSLFSPRSRTYRLLFPWWLLSPPLSEPIPSCHQTLLLEVRSADVCQY